MRGSGSPRPQRTVPLSPGPAGLELSAREASPQFKTHNRAIIRRKHGSIQHKAPRLRTVTVTHKRILHWPRCIQGVQHSRPVV
ncbi:unnamed protein product [Pieris brassicae]|uniref:Uncharacterized protein n=1 Tax=Pieris brassicae TaxID=7116 RepID=A0A9P0TBG5_PIEBR|nr:unnamed protein product [Pieris brassicae]